MFSLQSFSFPLSLESYSTNFVESFLISGPKFLIFGSRTKTNPSKSLPWISSKNSTSRSLWVWGILANYVFEFTYEEKHDFLAIKEWQVQKGKPKEKFNAGNHLARCNKYYSSGLVLMTQKDAVYPENEIGKHCYEWSPT